MKGVHTIIRHPVFKSATVVLTGSMVTNFGAYLFHVFVGRILGPSKYSEFSALLSLFFVLNVPASAVQTILVRYFSIFYAKNEYSKAAWLFKKSLIAIIGTGVVGIVLSIPLLPYITDFFHIPQYQYFLFLFGIVVTQFIGIVCIAALQAFQKFTLSQILTNIGMASRLILGIVAAFFGVGWTLFSNLFSNVITIIFYVLSLKFLINQKNEHGGVTKKAFLSYSFPSLVATFGILALFSMDVLLVKHFYTSIEAGIYASLSVLGRVIFFASNAILFVIMPTITERKEKKQPYMQLFWITTGFVSVMSIIVTGMYFLFPKIAVIMLFGNQYLAAVPYVGIFGIFLSAISISNVITSMQLSLGKTIVWIPNILALLSQVIGISLFHARIIDTVYVNVIISGVLMCVLLLYSFFSYEKNRI
jgi:O-antigen/teichoic acid export membrane protein